MEVLCTHMEVDPDGAVDGDPLQHLHVLLRIEGLPGRVCIALAPTQASLVEEGEADGDMEVLPGGQVDHVVRLLGMAWHGMAWYGMA